MVTRQRTNFTENQKAAIYARDHATCAFSGISLWIFDYGIRPNYEMDWADHIKPSAKGGTSCLNNGICASHTFNSKKKDNGSDNIFFFKEGRVTPSYVTSFGFASNELLSDLKRRSKLAPNDWYLNRAIVNTYIAFDWRCHLEFNGITYKRDDAYWLKAAFRRFKIWQKHRCTNSIDERELIKVERPYGTDSILQIETIESEVQFYEWAESLWARYRINQKAFHDFYSASEYNQKLDLAHRLKTEKYINPDVAKGISQLLHYYSTSSEKAA